jgi:hypothetical protein
MGDVRIVRRPLKAVIGAGNQETDRIGIPCRVHGLHNAGRMAGRHIS